MPPSDAVGNDSRMSGNATLTIVASRKASAAPAQATQRTAPGCTARRVTTSRGRAVGAVGRARGSPPGGSIDRGAHVTTAMMTASAKSITMCIVWSTTTVTPGCVGRVGPLDVEHPPAHDAPVVLEQVRDEDEREQQEARRRSTGPRSARPRRSRGRTRACTTLTCESSARRATGSRPSPPCLCRACQSVWSRKSPDQVADDEDDEDLDPEHARLPVPGGAGRRAPGGRGGCRP